MEDEEKKHDESDAEKSDEDQWQDEDSGGSGSSSAIDRKSLVAVVGEDGPESAAAKKAQPEEVES